MKIAVAQMDCALGALEINLRKMTDFAERAKRGGAHMLVFPELADTGYDLSLVRSAARPWDESAGPALQEVAKRLSLALVCGLTERVEKSIYNSQVFLTPAGEVAARYRKSHLFGAERDCFASGSEWQSVVQGGWHFGLSICYDLRFPEVYRALRTEHGADVFLVSSAWPWPRSEHLRILALARAIENQSYLVLANRIGTDAALTFCGGSMIVSPAGEILASASAEDESLIIAELREEELRAVRDRMPVFADRRVDLYAGKTSPESVPARD